MSIFPINRYLGEDGEGDQQPQHNDNANASPEEILERQRLKKLLKKAKIRKSQAIVIAETGGNDGMVGKPLPEVIQPSKSSATPKKRLQVESTEKSGEATILETVSKKRKKNEDISSKVKAKGPVSKSVGVTRKEKSEELTNGEEVSTIGKDSKSPTPTTAPDVPLSKRAKRRAKKKTTGLTGTELGVDFGGFTVIGDVNQFRQQTVKRVLPEWLANPSVVSCNLKDDKAPIDSFGLDSQIVQILKQNFIPYFFPVQQQVIPWLISGHNPKLYRPSDICVSAPTGSGKTLAYSLPIIHVLKTSRIYPCVRAIVVLPTEVLATQVYSVFKTYTAGSGLSTFLMTKRLTFSAEREALVKTGIGGRLSTPHDIIIATAGRLIDHLEQTEGFDISQLQFLVVDEADRTLDDQEGDWLQRLESKFWASHPVGVVQPWKSLPLTVKWMPAHLKAFQKLLFSATLSQNPESLEKLHLFEPKLFTSIVERKQGETKEGETETLTPHLPSEISDSFVGKYSTPTELVESFVLCKKETKPLVLTYLISHFKWKRVLCFANTKENTHRLCLLLKLMGHLNVREVSSKWNPKTRDLVLKQFASGAIDILVTSDQMARGIDIPTVDYVVSFDLPGYTKTYIHRIGRCARAGREGQAVSLIQQDQIGIYKKTMKQTGKTNFKKIAVKNSDLRPLEGSFKEALAKLKTQVEEENEHPGKQHLSDKSLPKVVDVAK